MRRRAFVCGAAAAFSSAARASTSVLGGASFARDGAEFRLVDVLAPSAAEPFAKESEEILWRILALGGLDLREKGDADRWGRRVVASSVEAADGVRSVQELLLQGGAVRVRPESDDRAFIAKLLAAESAAREAMRGLWRLPHYAVRDAARHRGTGAFHLIEGRVVSAAVAKGRAYLNFGEDYKTDVTATADSRDARRWKKEGLEWETLAGARVRIRGYVAWINGPSLEIVHPMQIERLAA